MAGWAGGPLLVFLLLDQQNYLTKDEITLLHFQWEYSNLQKGSSVRDILGLLNCMSLALNFVPVSSNAWEQSREEG